MSNERQHAAAAAVTAPRGMEPAPWLEGRGRSFLREMVAKVSEPGVISLAGGLPDPALFPAEEYGDAVAEILRQQARALQYAPVLPALREQIVGLMKLRGVECTPEQVQLTTGAQQGIDIATRLLVAHGAPVALERLAYTGIHNTLAPFEPQIHTVATDLDTGPDTDALEEIFARHSPALTYVVPDGHNPLGLSVSLETRHRIASLAEEYGVPVLEDDPYGLLWFGPQFEPPLKALAPEWVIYLGSFSKILAPGLRLGWMVLPERLMPQVQLIKEASDLECSSLTQHAVSRLLADGVMDRQLPKIRESYGARRDALLQALGELMPSEARWTQPRGGMFAWLELPSQIDTRALLDVSLETEKVAFIPGAAFASTPGETAGNAAARLSFATLSPAQIREAVEKLAACIRRSL